MFFAQLHFHCDFSSAFFICSDGEVTFSLTAAIVSIEFTATADGVALNSFQGGISSMVQNCVGITMAFGELCRILKQAGINVFPEDDAFCYCESKQRAFRIPCK